MENTKFMSVKQFRELGLLHELNRQFLHPLGLALEIAIDETGEEKFGRIWDNTDDPEGIVFGKLNRDKMTKAKEFMDKQIESRKKSLSYVIQENDFVENK